MRKNEFQIRVNWGDTDKAGIVYYPNYFKWFDIAGHQFFRSIGLSPSTLEKDYNIIIPLLDAHCSFHEPLYYDDVMTIKTEITEINRKTLKLSHEIYCNNRRKVFGHELRGWVTEENGKIRAVEIPDNIKRMLEKEEKAGTEQGNPWLMA